MITRRRSLAMIGAAPLMAKSARAEIAKMNERIDETLGRHFTEAGTTGTFVAYFPREYRIVASDKERSAKAVLPASTFKIPNSLIALETGVVADPDKDVFKWDGVTREIPEWNKDHTLRTAILASAVPVYQEIARRIGPERMQKYVDAFDYGNHRIGGGIGQFWLRGGLRIDPGRQNDFVNCLRLGPPPASARAQQLTRDIMPATKVGDGVIRAKTGIVGAKAAAASGNAELPIGWLVGWAEKGEDATVFAMNLDIREQRHIGARMQLTQKILAQLGAI